MIPIRESRVKYCYYFSVASWCGWHIRKEKNGPKLLFEKSMLNLKQALLHQDSYIIENENNLSEKYYVFSIFFFLFCNVSQSPAERERT